MKKLLALLLALAAPLQAQEMRPRNAQPVIGRSIESARLHSESPLNNGSTFTSSWERFESNDVLITCKADTTYTLYADFSPDGVNVDSTLTFKGAAGIYEIHRLVKGDRYMRVRVDNASGSNQTYLRLHTSYGSFGPLTAPRNLTVGQDNDTLITRPTDFTLDQAQGRFSGESTVRKFGYNPSVGTTAEIVSAVSTTTQPYWLTSATAVQVESGGNSNDTSAGTGAQTITVEGLDENFAEASESITLAGASASSATSTTFIRLFRAYVTAVGTYHGSNTGVIDIETTGGTNIALIEAGIGQTQLGIYTIPAGKTGYLKEIFWAVEGTKSVTLRLFQYQNADDVTTSFSGAKRLIKNLPSLEGEGMLPFTTLTQLPAETDVWLEAQTSSGTSAIAAGFELILVDD